MTNKYHRQGYRIGGILKIGQKLFAKTAPERKDQLLESIKKEIQKEFNVTYQQYENNIKLIEIEKRNNEASERFFQRAKNQFFQGQLSRSDFRLAQVDLSISKNRLNQSLFMAKIAELNLYRLSGKIINETVK